MTAKMIIRDVHKAFGAKKVLSGVSLDIAAKESLAVIGRSGIGKSVLIKCILGIIEPDRGSIIVDGQETVGMDSHARRDLLASIGMLFQGGALFDSLPVWRNVAFALLGRGMSEAQGFERAVSLLRDVGLGEEVAQLRPAELSGGMQKRVGLARALAGEPQIIFFDEPTTGLDPIMGDVINDLLRSVVDQWGLTTLTITHDMASVRKIADKVAMLHEGTIMWHGKVADMEKSGNPYMEQFVRGSAQGPIQIHPSQR